MKKTLLTLLVSTLFISGAAQAGEDISASMHIGGLLKPAQYDCMVRLSESSVSILEKSDTLIKQGDNATAPTLIHITMEGDAKCDEFVTEGKIAYLFQGVADDANGTALANALTDPSAAKGVAIGVFDEQNKPLALNKDLVTAKTDTVFGLQMIKLNNQEAVAGNINSTLTVMIERL